MLTVPLPLLSEDMHDRVGWIDGSSVLDDYSLSKVYASLDGIHNFIPWHSAVWFKEHIPKHAFCLWLACHKRLPTQYPLMMWKENPPDL